MKSDDLQTRTTGFVYVMTNPAIPDMIKVGYTRLLPEDRASDLFTTGVPEPFEVVYRRLTSRPLAVESETHSLLSASRWSKDREFFRTSLAAAVEAVRLSAVKVEGIASWEGSNSPHVLRSGDRPVLTLDAGQIFACVSYRTVENLLTGSAEISDLWEAHSTGDVLELFVSGAAEHVAGMSTEDPGGIDDPLPYLNRERTAANGVIIGRERLVPGQRLVWLPSPENSESQASITFEAEEYCQVVMRTWDPKVGPDGYPLVLNSFSYYRCWPAAERSLREALSLPLPRTWAPPYGRDSDCATIGSKPQPPEYWLAQLSPRRRKEHRPSRRKVKPLG
jgi:T5orf172 domain